MLDFSRCRLPPFAHQREDTEWLTEHKFAFLASEMRTGKSAIVIMAAQFLFEAGEINRVIVVAPAPVRDVWADKTLGELAKHLWSDLPATVTEYHARTRTWVHATSNKVPLEFFVTNYEFIKSKNRLAQLLLVAGPKTLLVLDESSYVKNHSAQRTKTCLQLRRACGRVVLLNGTPIFHSPMDLFSQGNILHSSVLDCKFVTLFKARYAIQGPILGYGGKALLDTWKKPIMQITGWTNLDDLQRRFAPVTVRRMQADCLDLPPKLDSVALTAVLDTSWPAYQAMKREMVVWLKSGDVATASTAAIKALRLSQITSGFLGGVERSRIDAANHYDELIENAPEDQVADLIQVQEIGREKLDVLLWFLGQRLEEDPNVKIVAWVHFRPELARMVAAVKEAYPQFEVAAIHGGQKKDERLRALALLKPETAPAGPVFVGGTAGTGSFGLDFSASHTCVTVSGGYSPGQSKQMLDRVYGPGQTSPIAYYTILATGPKGQRTIDHTIEAMRRAGQDLADLTTSAWITALEDE